MRKARGCWTPGPFLIHHHGERLIGLRLKNRMIFITFIMKFIMKSGRSKQRNGPIRLFPFCLTQYRLGLLNHSEIFYRHSIFNLENLVLLLGLA